jgi:hypothetical protein
MPWRGVTLSEQRHRFLEDYQLNYYPVSELAERFSISRKTAYKWINRLQEFGQRGFQERSRRPKLPVADGWGCRPGACGSSQGTPPLGPSQAAEPDASTAPPVVAPGGLDRSADPGETGVGPVQTPHSTGSPGWPQ